MEDSEESYASEARMKRLYDEGRQLFLQGRYHEAIEPFQRIYQVNLLYRDVVEIVHDYYDKEQHEWIAKYAPRFQQQDNGR